MRGFKMKYGRRRIRTSLDHFRKRRVEANSVINAMKFNVTRAKSICIAGDKFPMMLFAAQT
jgi:hypothetical protein